MSEAFVYIWKDMTCNKFYIGKHKGKEDDGYISSSKLFIEEYNQRPNDFQRKIVAFGADGEMYNLETSLLEGFDAANHPRFYNKYNNRGRFYNDGSEEIKRLQRNTWMRTLGVDNPSKASRVRKKMSRAAKSSEVQQKRRRTLQLRYGVDHPTRLESAVEKKHSIWEEKYGVKEVLSSNSPVRKKQNKTKIERYGTDNILTLESIRNKIKESNMKKYGVDNLFKCKDFQEELKARNLEKYGVTNVAKLPEIQQMKKDNFKKRANWPQDELIDYITSKYKHLYQSARGGKQILNVSITRHLNLRDITDREEILNKLREYYNVD